jgi:hypothetical protein
MYSLTLLLHSWWRWAVLATVAIAAVRAVGGVVGSRPWGDADRRANMRATVSLDIQMLLGLLLYLFLSPITTGAFSDFGAAMRTAGIRFWLVEHPSLMVVALAVAHAGTAIARKGASDSVRHRRSAIFFVIVLLLVLMGTPWPGMSNGRPFFRFGF